MIYRSPEWLRWLIDFEICTGVDIKGKPSKRKQAKINAKLDAERAAMEAKRLADEAATRQRQREYERILRESRQKAEEERLKAEKENRQRKINQELDDLYDRMIKDWTRNPYTDKVSTPNIRGEVHFHFRFENGQTFKIEGNNLVFSNVATFTINPFTRSRFVNLANHFTNNSTTRPSKSSSSSDYFDFDDFFSDFKQGYGQRQGFGGGYNSGKSQSDQSKTDQQARSQNTHPKAGRYNSLLDTISDRKRQLSNMKKSDSSWEALNNELQAAIRTTSNMKEKYKFKY